MSDGAATLDSLPEMWHSAPRRWGHPLHSSSSYMAMFPPTIPHVFTRWLTEPGDVVYDPFCGRGTTPLEACLLGRRGFGSDANPLAWVLTSGRVQVPTKESIVRRLRDLRHDLGYDDPDQVPDKVRVLFDAWTLGRLLFLRRQLELRRRSVDRFLMAVLLGALHGNANRDGSVRGLTVPMPNTFAMAPDYTRRYVELHGLKPPRVEPLDFLERRALRLAGPVPGHARGKAWLQDARRAIVWPSGAPLAKLVFTSPPYMQVVKYGKYNWIRLWLLGFEAPEVDDKLVATSSLTSYMKFIRSSVLSIRATLRDDGYLCLVLGDVVRPGSVLNLAQEIAQRIVPETDLNVAAVLTDQIPVRHKVSRIWRDTRVRATKVDRILVLRAPDAPGLPSPPQVNWRREWTSSKN